MKEDITVINKAKTCKKLKQHFKIFTGRKSQAQMDLAGSSTKLLRNRSSETFINYFRGQKKDEYSSFSYMEPVKSQYANQLSTVRERKIKNPFDSLV